jgi:beta-phosphoglucomutase-like phosphatase (HAD superfamily)
LIESVIFDLDGTLINLPINYEKLFEEFSKTMKTANVRPLTKIIPKLDEKTKKKLFEVHRNYARQGFGAKSPRKFRFILQFCNHKRILP